MKKLFFLLLIFIFTKNVQAQKGLSISVNSGLVSEYKVADGFFFSFDVGIPIVKSLEFAPTFMYYMVSSNTKEHTFMNNSVAPNDDLHGLNYSDTSGVMDLMLVFKPLDLMAIKNGKRHDFGLGLSLIGFGYHTQLRTNSNNGTIDSFSYYQGSYFNYFDAKIFYNYRFTETLYSGFVLGTTQVGNYTYFGVQFGLNTGKRNQH